MWSKVENAVYNYKQGLCNVNPKDVNMKSGFLK
jgi:hypothetical protein